MRFHLFLHHIHNNIDPDLKAFIAWKNRYCTSGKFPQSSDPAVLALFLMDKLNPQQALGYKKAMILYFEYEQNKLSKKYLDKQAFIEMLNIL